MSVTPRDDGSAIHTIVFRSLDRQPAKLPRGVKARKQWACPGCGRAVGADTLLDFETGWSVGDAGRWWTKGICPHCWKRVQFTKHGAAVLDYNIEGKPVTAPKTVIRKKGETRR